MDGKELERWNWVKDRLHEACRHMAHHEWILADRTLKMALEGMQEWIMTQDVASGPEPGEQR